VAVSNPIYVDVGGDGFKPHSPLDDKCECVLSWRRVPLAKPGAEPGRIRATIWNRGTQVARDVIRLESSPEDCITVLGKQEQEYTVAPGGEATLDFDVVLSDAWLARGLPAITYSYIFARNPVIRAPRSSVGEGRKGASLRIEADHHASQLPHIEAIEDVAGALAREMAYPFSRGGDTFGEVRFAIAGRRLALSAQVRDTAPAQDDVVQEGSCIEVFGAMRGEKVIGQVFLVPQVGGAPARAFQQVKGEVVPAPGVEILTTPTPNGYRLDALVPPDLLHVRAEEEVILLEFRVTTHAAGGKLARGTVFQSGAPDRDSLQFGRIRIGDRVRAGLDIVRPPLVDADAEPGLVRVSLKNRGDALARGQLSLAARPERVIRVAGSPNAGYELAPGEERAVEFRVVFDEWTGANAAEFYIPPTPNYDIVRSPSLKLAALGRLLRLGPVSSATGVQAALADRRALTVKSNGRLLADVRFAVAGEDLALSAEVKDPRITRGPRLWDGSCFEVFGSMPGKEAVGQVFLLPPAGGEPAKAVRAAASGQVETPQIRMECAPRPDGYVMNALIPLSMLAIDPAANRFLLEAQVTVTDGADAGGKPKVSRGTLFGSTRAYNDNALFALVIVDK
jgi:hypothetical protein